jgi:hypothetical protein
MRECVDIFLPTVKKPNQLHGRPDLDQRKGGREGARERLNIVRCQVWCENHRGEQTAKALVDVALP